MLFGHKRMYPENNSGRECSWPYLIGQHPLSPVLGQKRPGTPGNSCFAQLPPVFGHFLFRFWPFFVPFLAILCAFPVGYSTTRTDQHGPQEQLTARFGRGGVEVDNIFSFFCKHFGSNQLYPCLSGGYSRSFITPARITRRTSAVSQGDA